MARIEGVPEKRAGLVVRFAYWFSRRRFRRIPEPLTVTAHHPWIFQAYTAYEFLLDKAKLVEPTLKALAAIKAATLIGCPF